MHLPDWGENMKFKTSKIQTRNENSKKNKDQKH